jgi:predicted phage gp36 major capsid-like protein
MAQGAQQKEQKDLLTRLADAGEDAIHRLSIPGADRLTATINSMRERSDEVQRRLRGLDSIERRVAELEARVAELEGSAPAGSAKRTTSSRKRTATTRAKKTTSTAASSTARSSTGRKPSGSAPKS